jgi:hypothetical protein
MTLKLYNDNYVDQSTITASSQNALFPTSNLKDYRRSKVFRSTSNSDHLIFDMQETSLITTVFIVADKRSGFGVSTVTVQFNATSDFTSPAFSISVPFSVKFGLGVVEFPQVAYRFARIVMTSSLGYCELSKVYIGKPLALSRSINFGWTIKDEELSTKQKNRYGQLFIDTITRQKTIGFAMNLMNKDDLDIINELIDSKGESKPFYIQLGCAEMTNDNRRFSGPVYMNDIPTITNTNFNRYAMSFSVTEVT